MISKEIILSNTEIQYRIRMFDFCNICKYNSFCELNVESHPLIISQGENEIKKFCGFKEWDD